MPVEIEVTGPDGPLSLTQLQEDWFDDVQVADLEALLCDGTAWTAALSDGRNLRWVLSGREIYVLSHHPDLSGFVGTPKVLLGKSHVVLCTARMLPEVRRVISEGGSPDPVILGSDEGVPPGWIGLRSVIPHIPLSSTTEADILNVLRADADLRIELEGGIRVGRSWWLLGHPPKIRVLGQQAAGDRAFIDNREVQLDAAGCLVADGADHLGQHSVTCGNISRIYSIVEGIEHWDAWDAYCWSMGDVRLDEKPHRPAICGPLVRVPSSAPDGIQVVLVPVSNELLLGAAPGEIERCDTRADIAASKHIALPSFNPVWAAPANILRCDKRNAKLVFIGDRSRLASLQPRHRAIPLPAATGKARKDRDRRIAAWCTAVLNAGRKGLQIEPSADDIAALWLAYKRCARSIWRGKR